MSNSDFMCSRANRSVLLVCSLGILIVCAAVVADENTPKPPKSAYTKLRNSGPYCGLYCIYTVLKLVGQEADFQDLVKPEYMGSRKGSSLRELKKAVEDNGLYAIHVNKLTSRELSRSDYPIVLHVKSDVMSRAYDHFELFLGTKGDQARLFDPPYPVRLAPFRELAPRWDGNGLVISAEPIDLGSVLAPARRQFATYATIALLITLIVRWAKRWLPLAWQKSQRQVFRLSAAQGAGFVIVALLCGVIYHVANDEGLLANTLATASIQRAHRGNFIPKTGERKVHKLLDSDTVFIDARLARDYQAGHLEGAISVPVDANDVELQKTTADISKDSRIVMYCQSSACKYAEIVAIKLITDGFSNISIFRGGWAEWTTKNGKNKRL